MVRGGPRAGGAMAKVRWGLIGATVIGREWMIDAIRQAGGDIVAVMSTDPARGRAYAHEFGIPQSVSGTPGLFSAEVEAVYISTTNERHRAETSAAAKAGVHVLCEKPLATSLADARDMVAACKSAGVAFATNHHLRNGAVAVAMRTMIGAGRIGRPLVARIVHAGYLPEHLHGWRLRDPKAGAGAILDLTVHDTDLLRFILGDEPESVAAFSQNGGLASSGIEDAALTLIRFRSGLLAQLFDGFTTRYAETGVEVHGSAGSLVARGCLAQTPRGTLTLRTAAGEEAIELDHHNYYVSGVRAFHDAMRGVARPSSSGEDGLASLATALAALDSARDGWAVAVRIDA
jgi:1,5-anhydro-D-fructose reductase (1,5-anhydro-D-mannitol-forming)